MKLNLYIYGNYKKQKVRNQYSRRQDDTVLKTPDRIPQDVCILEAVKHFTRDPFTESRKEIIHSPAAKTYINAKAKYPPGEMTRFPEGMTHYETPHDSAGQNSTIEVQKTKKGSPFLCINGRTRETDSCIPDISVTDSGMYRIIGAADQRIGIDLQQNALHSASGTEENVRRCRKLAARFFHPCESAYVLSADTEEQTISRFFQIWTAKEAYVKYTGTGIDGSFSAFSVLGTQAAASETPASVGDRDITCLDCPELSCTFIYLNLKEFATGGNDCYTLCICTDYMENTGDLTTMTMTLQQKSSTDLLPYTLVQIRSTAERHT